MRKTACILSVLLLLNIAIFTQNKNSDQKINQRIKEINEKLNSMEKKKDSILDQIYKIELQHEKEIIHKNNLERKITKIKKQIAIEEDKKKNPPE